MTARSRAAHALALLAVLAAGVAIGLWWERRSPAPAPSAAATGPRGTQLGAGPQAAGSATGPQGTGSPAVQDQPFLRVEGTSLAGVDPRGRRVWDLQARTLEVDRARERMVMTAVAGQFYSEGRPQLAFSAPSAVFRLASRDVELSGGVAVRARDGRTLRAARVRYAAGEGVLIASGDAVLTQPGVSIRADEVRTDLALARPRFSGNVVVRVTE